MSKMDKILELVEQPTTAGKLLQMARSTPGLTATLVGGTERTARVPRCTANVLRMYCSQCTANVLRMYCVCAALYCQYNFGVLPMYC